MEGSRDTESEMFTWTIENFSKLSINKHSSEFFLAGGHKWQVLIFHTGITVKHLAIYVAIDSTELAHGWSTCAEIELSVVNQIKSYHTVRKETQHKFNACESDFGFASFMPLSQLNFPGFLVNNTLIIKAKVAVCDDPKKKTGYVGLENQGSTSYMNTLLQTLFHLPYFRKAVYHMETVESCIPSRSIVYELQSLFYELQYSDNCVTTKNLTKSFGWDACETPIQQDAQEFGTVLCEKLEEKMKGTIPELFEGCYLNYIECTNVNYNCTRKETFWDLQLDVKGCRDVYASFDKYVSVERLEGDNRYRTERDGLQDARKGLLFINFPPVLQLHLKRFEYDSSRETTLKINDRFEFPLELDLDRENGKYLSPLADRTSCNLYMLHSVLVHTDGVGRGQYHAYIRPNLSELWLKFDDERVTKVDMKRVLEEQYGGEEERLPQVDSGSDTTFRFTKYSNAYMLVYIRKSDARKVICDVGQQDIAEHLLVRLKKELEEKNTRMKSITIKIENGDIICFQKSSPVSTTPHYRFPDVPSYLQYVRDLQVVRFRSRKKPKKDAFSLELSKDSRCDEVVEKVAFQLGIHNPSKIRLTPHNSISRQPAQTPFESGSVHLSDMLLNDNQTSDILYYDVLESSEMGTINRGASCVICLDAPKESACIPCGHLVGCASCLKKVKDRRGGCPICRTEIKEVVKIYCLSGAVDSCT